MVRPVWENRKQDHTRWGKSQTRPHPFGKISNRHLNQHKVAGFLHSTAAKGNPEMNVCGSKGPPKYAEVFLPGQRLASTSACRLPAHFLELAFPLVWRRRQATLELLVGLEQIFFFEGVGLLKSRTASAATVTADNQVKTRASHRSKRRKKG